MTQLQTAESQAMAATFAARTNAELAARYDEWAPTYDAENTASGFRLPYLTAALIARHALSRTDPILDAGCGTGLAGDALSILGFTSISGIDLSDAMLEKARARACYSLLRRMVLGEPLQFETDAFAAVVSSGVFTEGHAPASSFDELIRITRPGGVIVFSVRSDLYETGGFRLRQEELEATGAWKLRERSEPFSSFLLKEATIFARLFVYELL